VPDGVEDGDGCEQAGDDGQADGAQVVHSPLEAVRAPVGLRRGDIGKQCVACRYPQPTRCPSAGPQHPHLPHRRGSPNDAREHGGRSVAANSKGPPASRVVGHCPTGEASHPGKTIGDALDRAEDSRRRPERREQARQQSGRDLVSDIRQEAGGTDAGNPRREPAPRTPGLRGRLSSWLF
jgi:hypothetical protein